MTEHAEELYDEDEFEEEDELEDDDDEDRIAASARRTRDHEINTELQLWRRANHSAAEELFPADWQELGEHLDRHGGSVEEAYEVFTDQRQEQDFGELVGRIEAGEERKLAQTEVDRLWEANQQAELQGQTEVDVGEALLDLDSSEDRATYIAERVAAPRHEEPSTNLIEEDGTETPSYNYDDPNEREAAINAVMGGQTVNVHDSSEVEARTNDRQHHTSRTPTP